MPEALRSWRLNRLEDCCNIADLRVLAQKRLPAALFHYLDGGADDEWTLKRNTAAFDDYEIVPSQLRDVSRAELGTRVLGQPLAWPVILSPTGMSGLFHHTAEPAVARAAARSGVFYALSTLATTSIEEVAAAADGPKMFQIYVLRDRGLMLEFLQRCDSSKYSALCLTVDTPIAGNRERDRRTGMTMPPRFSAASLLSFAMHPRWTMNLLLHRRFDLVNVKHRVDALQNRAMSVIDYANSQFDRSVTWKDVEWLVERWGKALALKGLLSVADARRAADCGVSAIMVSNHGGRQLDGVPGAIDCIVPIVDAVGDRVEVILDGGVRRGTHILKALALGARAVSIGRPYLFGLASAGEQGVDRALEMLRSELARSLTLMGRSSILELSRADIQHRNDGGMSVNG